MRGKHPLPVFLLLLLALLAARSWGETTSPGAEVLSLNAYQEALRACSRALDPLDANPEKAIEVRAKLPGGYKVSEGGRTLEVSNAWLNSALVEFTAAKPDKQPDLLRRMRAHLAAQQEQAESFRARAPYSAATRRQLTEILARREFRHVRGPTLWDIWMQRITGWIIRALDRLFTKVAYTPRYGRILVWIAIAIVLCVVAIWLKRMASRQMDPRYREPTLFAPSEKHWRRWLAEARDAAQQGRWRDAVHLAYWAAISHLEQSGAWAPDRARTPREYLRLLPAVSERRPTLEALTRRFELIWYGQRDAADADFEAALAQLEKLGCR